MKRSDSFSKSDLIEVFTSPLYKRLGIKLPYSKHSDPIFRDIKKKIDYYKSTRNSIPNPQDHIWGRWAMEIMDKHKRRISSVQHADVVKDERKKKKGKKPNFASKKNKKTLRDIAREVGLMFPFLKHRL